MIAAATVTLDDRAALHPGARLVDPILRWASSTPHADAIADETTTLTYGQLGATIERLVAALSALGLSPGDRLMLVGENSVALVCLLLAGNRLGAGVALENARRAPLEIASIFDHCRPRLAIFVAAGSPNAARHASHFGAEPRSDAVVGDFGVVTGVRPSRSDEIETAANRFAIMIYTTGMTGIPKGVMLTDANFCFIATMMATIRDIGPDDRVYGVLPATHVMGLASVLLGSLQNGAHLHLRARFSPATCLTEMRTLRITALQGATAMFAKLVERARIDGWTAPGFLRFAAAGGAPIDATVKQKAEALFGVTLHNGYGLTEAASTCWTREEDDNADESVGRPLPGVEIRIRDESGVDLPNGSLGELWVRGANVMRGYFRAPDQTRQVMTTEGWFNTHDLARIGGDGRVMIAGRAKDVIFRSGFKVNPLEVETAINRHSAILHSAVVGRAVEGNEEIVAFVELAPSASGLPDDLRDFLRDALSPYKIPSEIVVVAALPLAPNGKVLKTRLQIGASTNQ